MGNHLFLHKFPCNGESLALFGFDRLKVSDLNINPSHVSLVTLSPLEVMLCLSLVFIFHDYWNCACLSLSTFLSPLQCKGYPNFSIVLTSMSCACVPGLSSKTYLSIIIFPTEFQLCFPFFYRPFIDILFFSNFGMLTFSISLRKGGLFKSKLLLLYFSVFNSF